jgi:hypothetical protein
MYYESSSKHYPLTSTYFFSLTIHLAKHGFIVILWNGVYILKCSTSSCFKSSLTRYSITGFNQKLEGARYGLYGGKSWFHVCQWFFHHGRLVSSCIIMQQADTPGTSARTGIVVMFHDLWQNFGGIKWFSDTSTFWYRNLSYMSFFIKNNAYIILLTFRLRGTTCVLRLSFPIHALLSLIESC